MRVLLRRPRRQPQRKRPSLRVAPRPARRAQARLGHGARIESLHGAIAFMSNDGEHAHQDRTRGNAHEEREGYEGRLRYGHFVATPHPRHRFTTVYTGASVSTIPAGMRPCSPARRGPRPPCVPTAGGVVCRPSTGNAADPETGASMGVAESAAGTPSRMRRVKKVWPSSRPVAHVDLPNLALSALGIPRCICSNCCN